MEHLRHGVYKKREYFRLARGELYKIPSTESHIPTEINPELVI
jgi:hypothetical protein